MTENFSLPDAALGYAQHFTDPLYDDEGDDLAPFGSDEGSDLLWTWADRRDELIADPTLATVLECEPDEVREVAGPMEGIDGVDTAALVVGAAFVLLRLTGRLNDGDRALAIEAVDYQLRALPQISEDLTDPPQLLTIRRDLQSWTNLA
ncbi:hypothetical protein [Nocardioides sp. CFH 31398]|uniref:hypothetical protein n=1 Tax=Nocardioides sp. CFH 31398 TaxID=2919579 RepID=UPI001F050DB8|nr:hypothetical protein [Nocardioides sp. CFH 31398]MCH1865028.1 hypothetical protein [Nocardioides sp. CFH 31398]